MDIADLKESFSTTLDPAKWTATLVTAVSGRGVFQTAAVPNNVATLITPVDYNATGSSLSAKLTPTTLPAGVQAVAAQLEMALIGPYNSEQFGNESIRIQISASPVNGETITLTRSAWSGPAPSYINIPYNRTNHAYARIRISGTDAFMDTSPDGKTWTSHGSIKHLLSTLSVKPRFQYFHQSYDPAYIDDVNLIPSSGAFLQFF